MSRARRHALLAALWLAACLLAPVMDAQTSRPERPRYLLVVHGGAGTITRRNMTPAMDSAYRAAMTAAIRAGRDVLERGGTSVDAVQATITVLEDSPLFNAGKGAVFTSAGTNELDAAVMDGRTLDAGAVAGVKRIRNPVELARLVMERSHHILLVGEGAEAFAREQGMPFVPNEYFRTERRWEALQRAKEKERQERKPAGTAVLPESEHRYGTVGAVALDSHGDLAAATSTGGTTNKHWGRVGDSPIIGAGTYADNESCAVSATGTGEYFIRNAVAYDICARMKYAKVPLQDAARTVIHEVLPAQGGDGGVIALDRQGNMALEFNTEGMYRGWVSEDGRIVVKIYGGE